MATASFTLGPGPFPAGTTVGVYRRRVLIGPGGPIGAALTSAVTDVGLRTAFTGLEYEEDYTAAALVAGAWRKVSFTTDLDPALNTNDLAPRMRAVEIGEQLFVGPIDFSDVDTPDFAVRRQLSVESVAHGSNGVRGDSLSSDASNAGGAGGATFVAQDFITVVHADRGSIHGYTAVITLEEIPGDPNVYAEAGTYESLIICNRKGAYVAGLETGILIGDGFPAKANGISIGIQEHNTLADYASAGLSSQWEETGARGIWLWNAAGIGGLVAPGTGIFMEGNWERAAIYTQMSDQSALLLKNRQAGGSDDFFSIDGLGHIHWGLSDASSAVELQHDGAGGLILTGQLTVSDEVQVSGILNVVGAATFGADANVTGTVNTGALGVGTNALIAGQLDVEGNLIHNGAFLRFFGGAGSAKPTIAGSRGANAALADLLTKLAATGLIVDGSTV